MAERKLNGAVREEVALREAAPSPDVLEALAEAARRGAAATREAAAETQRVEKEIASIEGGLAVLQDDGAGERADRLAGEAEAAAGSVAAIERELRELTLLAKALSEAEAALRTSLETPVLHCIGPYLELVLPRARLALDGGLGPLALSRAGVDEQLDRLSEGTQEQVSILARLGLAALAAERGASLPLVLDDPLAYTDDERLARLLMVLERASAKHQVVVLTSRARAFERLGGTRLSLQPWAAV